MKKPVLMAIVAGCLAIGVIAIVAAHLLENPRAQNGASIVQSNGPVSVDEARRGCPIAIPPGARNVQYATYSDFQAFAAFVKYEAPADVCIEAGKELLAADGQERRKNGRAELEGLHALSNAPASLQTLAGMSRKRLVPAELSVAWFDPESIAEGLEGGGTGSHEPKVWIDTRRGIFYYQLHD